MRVLAIESSTEWLSVAAGDESSLRERREHAGQTHSERVLALVESLLDECGWLLEDLDGIAFGAGPGSFTGVRIACGVAQGLALGVSKPVVPVPTLEALAQEAARVHGATRVFACLDARMREVYVAAYERAADAWREVVAPSVAKPADVTAPDGQWFGAGAGFKAYKELATRLGIRSVDDELIPSARAVAELALPRLAAGAALDPADALPLYVRHRVALTTAERAAGGTL